MKEQNSVLPLTRKKNGPSSNGVQIWAVSSGKGGVGKSFISASLGTALAKQGLKVTLVDFDLSGANLHTWFGVSPMSLSLVNHFLLDQKKLNEIEVNSGIHNLKLIMGFNQTWTNPSFSTSQMNSFYNELKKLNSDIVIIDLGAGISSEYLELLSLADEKIFISSPEPQSIEKYYRLMESYCIYNMNSLLSGQDLKEFALQLSDYRIKSLGKPFSLKTFFGTIGKLEVWEKNSSKFKTELIINQVRSFDDENLGPSIKSVVNKYFDAQTNYLGYLQFDNAVWQCARKKSSVLIEQPFNPLVGQFLSITKQLIDPRLLKAVV